MGIKVLSLCDGLSCGNMALEKLGIKVDAYYASEIKTVAISTTKINFPNTVHIGDVTKVSYSNGILHTENGDFEVNFDLVMFGSPCQSFSRAMRTEKRIGLEDSMRSGIFLHCHRILNEVKPKYFFMENVVMKAEDEKVITDKLGVEPIKINSKVITAQNRARLYWTNIPQIKKLEPKNVKVQDILKDGYYPHDKTACLMKNESHGYFNGGKWSGSKRFYRWYAKWFNTIIFPNKEDYDNCVAEYKRIVGDKKPSASLFDDYNGKVFDNFRYLWKEERARLQTIPEKYIKNLSEKDAADLIGDGWTVDVIAHLLSGLKRQY